MMMIIDNARDEVCCVACLTIISIIMSEEVHELDEGTSCPNDDVQIHFFPQIEDFYN